MVSTRGPKFKFSEGEKVLCYEPDPTKAKVLYDSKVLEVKVTKDQRGRKSIEFLIHFQGWNSSWDRCVTEDFVLKDTEENRQLQRDLAQKAQLQLCSNYRRGAYLYRKDRTKRQRKLSDRVNDSLERQKGRRRVSTSASATSNSNGSATSACVDSDQDSVSQDEDDHEGEHDEDGDNNAWGENSSDESSEAEGQDHHDEDVVEERIPMEVSTGLKRLLEHDCTLINQQNKVLKLPAEPNVVTILEGFVKHCAVNQLCNSHTAAGSSKNGQSQRYSYKYLHHKQPQDLDSICRNLTICKEVADGLRVYFDFTLADLLLYSQEKVQFSELTKCESPFRSPSPKKEPESESEDVQDVKSESIREQVPAPEQEKDAVKTSLPSPPARSATNNEDQNTSVGQSRKRSLRSSHRSAPEVTSPGPSVSDAVSAPVHSAISSVASSSPQSSIASPVPAPAVSQSGPSNSSPPKMPDIIPPQNNAILSQVMTWHLVPPSTNEDTPILPSLLYGATHLARLFVRLPDLLYTGNMPSSKLKVLTSHLETFMAYLEEHTEWFADHNYKENDLPSEMNKV